MQAYKITGLKDFMNKLLVSNSFDCFLMEEGTVTTCNTFSIDGRIKKEFYTREEQENTPCPYDFSLWKDMKTLCFDLIKGKRTPLNFKFVFLLLPEQTEKLLADGGFDNRSNILQYLSLIIKYDGSGITLVTGISTETFLMDKTPDRIWDQAFVRFLEKYQIAWEDTSISSS